MATSSSSVKVRRGMAESPHGGNSYSAVVLRERCLQATVSSSAVASITSRLRHRFSDLAPPEPSRFHFGYDFLSPHEAPFRRGFPHFIDCQVDREEWTPEETARGR